MKHKEQGSILTIDREKFNSYDYLYNHQAEGSDIDVKIKVTLANPDDTDGTEGSSHGSDNFKSDIEREEEKTNALPKPSEPSGHQPVPAFPPKCYHCDFSSYETKQDYESHCVLRHPGKTAYPGPADIKEGLTVQGMVWET